MYQCFLKYVDSKRFRSNSSRNWYGEENKSGSSTSLSVIQIEMFFFFPILRLRMIFISWSTRRWVTKDACFIILDFSYLSKSVNCKIVLDFRMTMMLLWIWTYLIIVCDVNDQSKLDPNTNDTSLVAYRNARLSVSYFEIFVSFTIIASLFFFSDDSLESFTEIRLHVRIIF